MVDKLLIKDELSLSRLRYDEFFTNNDPNRTQRRPNITAAHVAIVANKCQLQLL